MQELHLSEENELQLQAYLRFAKLKRDQHVRETLMVIKDFQKEKLEPGEMYNHQEAVSLFEELKEEVRALVDKEIQHAYHTNGLLIKLLISQAEKNGMKMAVDTNSLENDVLLRQVAKSELEALGKKPTDFASSKPQIIAPVSNDSPELVKQVKQLQEEKSGMQERLHQLQEQLREARDAMDGKLQESVQFQQLRKLMQAKTAEVKELRLKLNKYEPQNVPSADD